MPVSHLRVSTARSPGSRPRCSWGEAVLQVRSHRLSRRPSRRPRGSREAPAGRPRIGFDSTPLGRLSASVGLRAEVRKDRSARHIRGVILPSVGKPDMTMSTGIRQLTGRFGRKAAPQPEAAAAPAPSSPTPPGATTSSRPSAPAPTASASPLTPASSAPTAQTAPTAPAESTASAAATPPARPAVRVAAAAPAHDASAPTALDTPDAASTPPAPARSGAPAGRSESAAADTGSDAAAAGTDPGDAPTAKIEPATIEPADTAAANTDAAGSTPADAGGAEATDLLRVALRLLPAHLVAEAVHAGCPWTQDLPPAGRRQFVDAVERVRHADGPELEALIVLWRGRAASFTR